MNFSKGSLPSGYKLIETEDGSQTLYSPLYDEACHSTHGAIEETKLHYIQGCQIEEKLKEKDISILEVGFGTGIGFIETAKVVPENRLLDFFSLEIDKNLVEYFFQQHELEYKVIDNHYIHQKNNVTLSILVGDARVVLASYLQESNKKFHAIYQDAFSPKRNASLWTTEWFTLLGKYSSEDCILSTYSSSSAIRKSMLAANWRVQKGEKFGPKRSSTRAKITGESDPEILEHLKRSQAITLTDDNAKECKLK